MSADVVIRGGTLVDGTGAPRRRADIAITDGVVSDIGTGLDGRRELDAAGHIVSPGFVDIHTHYDAQVFWDPALSPVLLARRHERGRGQLRVLDRAGATRAPRAARADAATRRGHVPRHAVRRRPVGGLRDVPAVLRRDRVARHAPQLRVLRRPHRGAALRHGHRRLRARRHRRRDPRHAAGDRRRARRGRGRLRDIVLDDAQRRSGPAGAVAHRRAPRADGVARAAARRRQGRRRAAARARRSPTRTCSTSSGTSGDRSRGPRCSRSRASRGTRRSWRRTSRPGPRASRCGRRCRAARSCSR